MIRRRSVLAPLLGAAFAALAIACAVRAPADTGLPAHTDADADADSDTDADADTDSDADTDADADADSDTDADTDTDSDTDSDTDTDTDPPGDCISGAVGDRAVRFRWTGSGAGSTASVVYEANELPDTSRWRARALSSSTSYRPTFDDVFLGEGGLDMGGTTFIDVELSTAGLGRVRRATLALYGRSFNTSSSGSFTWQTFSGTGATASGAVPNSAPYRWVLADATPALPAGDGSTLLRIRPGPPSNRLVVNRVEICFDAD